MKVYYNGSCNICDAEISHYKKINQNAEYVDISNYSDENIAHISKKNLFRRMHIFDKGKLIAGSESFLILWAQMPKWKYLAKLLKLPILRQVWFISYEFLALILFWKNKSKL